MDGIVPVDDVRLAHQLLEQRDCGLDAVHHQFVQGAAQAQQVTKPVVAGVTNFAKLDTTIACAGATTPAGVAEVKKMGYKSVINLRQASEPGADIEGEAAAAKTAGIRFFNSRWRVTIS